MIHHFKAPESIKDYDKYLEEIKEKKKFEVIGVKNKQWEQPKDLKQYLRSKSSLNLGEFFKAYCDVFGFGYQKMFKIIKAHKEYLLLKNIIVIKQKATRVNKKSNKDNKLEIIMINKQKYHLLNEFLKNFK